MNKTIITGLIFFSLSLCNAPLWAQQGNNSEDISAQEEDIIGGIGGTGIRSMSRPEILERPEQLERPELLESREAMDDLLETDSPNDMDFDGIETNERPDKPLE